MKDTEGRHLAESVRVRWCRTCEWPALLECCDEDHDTYEAVVTPLLNDGDGS